MGTNSKRNKRKRVAARDGAWCQCCGSTENLTIDHVIPRSLGGPNKNRNIQLLCCWCNMLKANKIIAYRQNSNLLRKIMNVKLQQRRMLRKNLNVMRNAIELARVV